MIEMNDTGFGPLHVERAGVLRRIDLEGRCFGKLWSEWIGGYGMKMGRIDDRKDRRRQDIRMGFS